MESRMTGGVRVAVACFVLTLVLGAKVREAIAAPGVAVSQTAFAQDASHSSPVTKPQEPFATAEAPLPKADPAPTYRSTPMPSAEPTPQSAKQRTSSESAAASRIPRALSSPGTNAQVADESSSTLDATYLDRMRAAGYPVDSNNDLNTLRKLKWLGVTPEYTKAVTALGLGKPTAQELMTLKLLGVTPEDVSSLKQEGLAPENLHEVVMAKALGITSDYGAAMKQSGLSSLDMPGLVRLKAQGVTPQYAQWLKQQFPQVTVEQLEQAAMFHIDDEFIAQANAHGFDKSDIEKLLRLKLSGLLNERQ